MAVNKDRAKATTAEVERVIDAGGSTPKKDDSSITDRSDTDRKSDVRFTVAMPAELAEIIDKLRKPTKTSRQAWLLQAAHEKLEREGKI